MLWRKLLSVVTRSAKSPRLRAEGSEQAAEIKRLKRELARVTEERNILKKGVAFVRHWSEDNGRARTSRESLSEVRVYSLPGRVLRSNVPRGRLIGPSFRSVRCVEC
jgi:transposase-like protein